MPYDNGIGVADRIIMERPQNVPSPGESGEKTLEEGKSADCRLGVGCNVCRQFGDQVIRAYCEEAGAIS